MVALFAAKAPAGIRGTMLGVNLLATFAGSVISGRLGGLYETLSPSRFWLLHAGVVAGAGLGIALVANPIRRRLGGAV